MVKLWFPMIKVKMSKDKRKSEELLNKYKLKGDLAIAGSPFYFLN